MRGRQGPGKINDTDDKGDQYGDDPDLAFTGFFGGEAAAVFFADGPGWLGELGYLLAGFEVDIPVEKTVAATDEGTVGTDGMGGGRFETHGTSVYK